MQFVHKIVQWFRSVDQKTRVAAVAAVIFLPTGFFYAGYKVYEYQATGGIGFYDAEDLAISSDVPVKLKKQMFFDFMRPIAIAENARVDAIRQKIIEARDEGSNSSWLKDIAESYDVEWTGEEWKRLLMRVDTVPITLILAQSANESSWGQSNFAQAGNNMFGQWCFSEGCGIVPARRDSGKNHEVAAYRSVNDSVRAYLNNINRTRAYSSLRAMRWKARQQGAEVRGVDLAFGLLSYSERREEYVREIQGMIRINKDLMLSQSENKTAQQ